MCGGSAKVCDDSNLCTDDGCDPKTGCTAFKGAGKMDAWLVRLDSNLNVMWDATVGGTADDVYHSVVALPDHRAVAAGTFRDPLAAYSYFLVARYNAAGVKTWQLGGGNGGDYHEIFAVALTPGLDILLGGVFASNSKDQYVVKRISPWGDQTCANCGKIFYAGCDDGLYCTADYCLNNVCFAPAMTALNSCDGDVCTTPDACSGSTCTPGPAKQCDDKNPCTLETCDKAKGCLISNVKDGIDCGGGKTCQSINGAASKCL